MNTQRRKQMDLAPIPQRTALGPRTLRSGRFVAVVSAALCALAALCASAQAAEEETHTFNAGLSLTGDCTTATVDPVPDPSCPEEPTKAFVKPAGVAVDRHGNRYVASIGPSLTSEIARVDVFNSAGEFITKIENIRAHEFEMSLAVDSQGYLYVSREIPDQRAERVLRFKPTKYDPAAGEIEYGEPPTAIPDPAGFEGEWNAYYLPLQVDPTNDHLFVRRAEDEVYEFKSAADGNALVQTLTPKSVGAIFSQSFAIDAARQRLYITDLKEAPKFGVPTVVRAYDLEAPHELLFTIDGSTTPTGRFISESRVAPIAVDEGSGHIFVGDLEAPTPRIYEFDAAGNPVSTFGEGRLKSVGVGLLQMAYDNSPTSPTQGYLFVPSDKNPGRSLAFAPKPLEKAPAVEGVSVSSVTTTEAILRAQVNPNGLQTTYRFEYLTEDAFQENGEGFEGAEVTEERSLAPSGEGIAVSAPVSGLQPGTAYRFRVVAENDLGGDEADAGFATFAPVEASVDCPNQPLRTGPSALLPDCRAYELVTPANTNGRQPLGPGRGLGSGGTFVNRQVSPDGGRVPFRIEGGALPGLEGTGSFNSDPYLASRTSSGWTTEYVGPSPAFATGLIPGNGSPDQTYFFWVADGAGNPAALGGSTSYLRYPDGHSELLGQGSLGTDPGAQAKLISEGGGHVIFATGRGGISAGVQLEPEAAPSPAQSLYDRTADGTLHVVSLKPGDEPFGAGESAKYVAASLDGTGVAFRVGEMLYLRYDNSETFAIGEGVTFAGLSEGGSRLFYQEGGDLFRFDAKLPLAERVTRFSDAGLVEPVTISDDGSAAYFVSETAIAESGPNPRGDDPQPGERNLYLSREGQIAFVATVTDRDVEGAAQKGLSGLIDGLGLWVESLPDEVARVPARADADGRTLLFKSRAALTDFDTAGHAQIYRYDFDQGALHCISCNPIQAAPSSDATLQSFVDSGSQGGMVLGTFAWMENLRDDGRRAFFETAEGLVAHDVDGRRDVYEWEEQGVGSCLRSEGCVYLISSGQSGHDEFLFGVSESGEDAFFLSSDLLAGGDGDETRSIYDARAGGGFPAPAVPAGECLGEACQPAAVAPNDPTPASSAFAGAGNPVPESRPDRPRCPKGKRAVWRAGAGKWRCVRRHTAKHQKHRKHQAKRQGNGNGRAGR
jgi:hypothetical protein